MLCENCKKNTATTRIRTVINGVVTEKNLCGYCAVKCGYSKFMDNGFASMISAMFGDELSSGAAAEKRCGCCGTRFSDIAESGKMGCSECYNEFREKIKPYLKRVHGTTEHVGKRPTMQTRALTRVETQNDIEKLKADLKKAIEAEEFEKAAALRDEIRAKEGGKNDE